LTLRAIDLDFANLIAVSLKLHQQVCMERNKMTVLRSTFFLIALLSSVLLFGQNGETFNVPVEYYKLPNGLRVVLSPDHTAPTVIVAVYYHIGFRIEPRDRTGFAHLFEHMMFQGSDNLGKMEFIKLVEQNGGVHGSTRFDFTNYFGAPG
jgi:zinc protease